VIKQTKFYIYFSDTNTIMETPGSKIILDLLAKSVAKINSDYPETGGKNGEKKRKKLNENGNEQDCLPLSNDHLKFIKDAEVKTENNKIETENTDHTKLKVEGISGLKKRKVKTEYVKIKTENIDNTQVKLEGTWFQNKQSENRIYLNKI
jgi:hypothetical protein